MKRRKNAVYKGQSKRASTGTSDDRNFVNHFYEHLNYALRSEDEIEIIPPEQVNPAHDIQHQILIMADYCVRKILPEITGLSHWGDEVTPRLHALAPVVDQETAADAADAATEANEAAYHAYLTAYDTVYEAALRRAAVDEAARDAAADEASYAARDAARDAAAHTGNAARSAARATRGAADAASEANFAASEAAKCVYYALVACIEAEDEAAYDRIIDLTNEMLESL